MKKGKRKKENGNDAKRPAQTKEKNTKENPQHYVAEILLPRTWDIIFMANSWHITSPEKQATKSQISRYSHASHSIEISPPTAILTDSAQRHASNVTCKNPLTNRSRRHRVGIVAPDKKAAHSGESPHISQHYTPSRTNPIYKFVYWNQTATCTKGSHARCQLGNPEAVSREDYCRRTRAAGILTLLSNLDGKHHVTGFESMHGSARQIDVMEIAK